MAIREGTADSPDLISLSEKIITDLLFSNISNFTCSQILSNTSSRDLSSLIKVVEINAVLFFKPLFLVNASYADSHNIYEILEIINFTMTDRENLKYCRRNFNLTREMSFTLGRRVVR